MYTPPFIVSAKAINLIAAISAQVERYAMRMEQADSLRLLKINRIKTIQQEYYEAINRSTAETNSGIFVDFMLQEILAGASCLSPVC
jgi:hypothetical protein